MAQNVLGGPLKSCSHSPKTGFYRDGCCRTGPEDRGNHVVCAEVTEEFLKFSRARGNDLTKPSKAHKFPGLSPGDRWCLCAERWKEAYDNGVAPPVFLQGTHETVLDVVELEALMEVAILEQKS